jgi:hypothetical protein
MSGHSNFRQRQREVYEHVADVVATAMARARLGVFGKIQYKHKGKPCERGVYAGQAEVSRRVGRDLRRVIWQIQQGESDCKISTLCDIAEATGHRLRIVMEPRTAETRESFEEAA